MTGIEGKQAAEGQGNAARVSVVIAAFDAERFIERAISSALDQAAVAVELIVVDDASADGTAERVLALAAADDRIRLVRLGTNGGPAAARNAGIDAATGAWVAVLDADDAYLPGRLAYLVAAAERAGADIVADGFHLFDANAAAISGTGLANEPAEELLDLPRFVAGARPQWREADFGLLKPLFRADFLRRHGLRYPAHVRHGEDFEMIVAALLGGARYLLCRKPFYLYTTRTSGFSRTAIDYRGQIARARELKMHPGVAGDARLRRLLDVRTRALERHRMQGEVDRMREEGGKGRLGLLRALLARRDGRRWLAGTVWRRLRRSIRASR